jgi:hypothetical protein
MTINYYQYLKFLKMFLSGNFGADYVATGVFVEEVNQLTVLIVSSMAPRKEVAWPT